MIISEVLRDRPPWWRTLLLDIVVPTSIVGALTFYLDRQYARVAIQALLDVPILGEFIFETPVFPFLTRWHFFIIFTPLFVFSWMISYRTARIPGPGRAFLFWWQGLLQGRLKAEEHNDIFPPKFSYTDAAVQKLITSERKKDPTARIIGYYKRFPEDIERDERDGKRVESKKDYFPIVLSQKLRYRHVQVTGGSGSGKSASIIAPLLIDDAATKQIATVTINPKADLYLIKVMAHGPIKRLRIKNPSDPWNAQDDMPTAVVSLVRKDSLAYDPLLFGDADAVTKKIIGSAENMTNEFYRAFQETWLMSFMRVVKTEPLLVDRIMLRHLFRFLGRPLLLQDELKPLLESEHNIRRVDVLSTAKPESLAGLASHVAQLVEDESLRHVFDNPTGPQLDIREVIRKGGNIFIEVDTSGKGPQSRALGRMIVMELQLLASARQAGYEPNHPGIMGTLDEFASMAYDQFVDLLDKCRSANMGLLLAHQSMGNLQRKNLARSFKDEIVDNTYQKFILAVKDETANWAAEQMGTVQAVKKSISIGHAIDKTDTGARENQVVTHSEQYVERVQASDFNLPLGRGYAHIPTRIGTLAPCPISIGYVDEEYLCSDEELFAFLRHALRGHGTRPRNGSLIDNDIPPGKPTAEIPAPAPFSESEIAASETHLDQEALEGLRHHEEREAKAHRIGATTQAKTYASQSIEPHNSAHPAHEDLHTTPSESETMDLDPSLADQQDASNSDTEDSGNDIDSILDEMDELNQ